MLYKPIIEISSFSLQCFSLSLSCDYVMINAYVLVLGPLCRPGGSGEPPDVPDANANPLP